MESCWMMVFLIKVTVAIFTVLLAPIVWWYFSVRKFKSLDGIPGPKPVPILGNAKDIGSTPQEIFKNLNQLSKKYDNLFKIYIGEKAQVVVSKSRIVEHILTSTNNITKSNGYDLVRPWIGDGLLLSTGQKWKSRRKMITPSFHFEILKKFMTIFDAASDVFVEKLSQEVDKEYVDVFSLANLLALDIICETSMGVKVNVQQDQNKDYVEAVSGYFDVMFTRFFSAWRRFDLPFKLFDANNYELHKKYLGILHGFSKAVVEQKRKEACSEASFPIESGKPKQYLLEMLLANPSLSDEDLREEVDTIMFAGHDTTASAIAFALFALSRHPDVQANVYNAILEAVGPMGKSSIATMEQIQSIKYLDLFLKEAQRMYPSIPMIERRLDHDCLIDNIEYPKNTTVNIFIYGLHHRPDYFPNPEKFDPLRFEKTSEIRNFSYVPFSAGLRNCIGQKFAVLETKTVIVKTLLNFEILPVDYELEMGMAAILKSCNGIRIKLKHR